MRKEQSSIIDGLEHAIAHATGGPKGLAVGTRVNHVTYGAGVITAIFGELYTATFSNREVRCSKWTLTPLAIEVIARECVDSLWKLGRYRQATDIYNRFLQGNWQRSDYDIALRNSRSARFSRLRNERSAKQAAARQATFRKKVERLLTSWQFDEADSLYRAECCDWWPTSEYAELKGAARRIQKFVQAYASGSLSELDGQYVSTFSQLSGDEYARLKLPKLRLRLARLGMPLNDEQLVACARPERHRLIKARAGSGKTRTLAAHAALTIHDESLNPDQVLILAFNRKAANEIGDRVRSAAGIDEFRNARTFHSLAWQLADHAGRELIFDDGNLSPSRRKQTGFVERLIGSIMNPAFRETLYDFFRHELEQLDRLGSNLSIDEYFTFRRSITDYTLAGETVKSNGEKIIADFLFEHGITYKYEKLWPWNRQDRLRGSPYRPDFYITDGNREVILEHWAIDPDDPFAQVPDWWETTTKDYLDQVKAKREFWAKRSVALLETHSAMLAAGRESFEHSVKALLVRAGFGCRKLDHDELVRRVAEAPRTVSRMAALFLQFISRAKKRGWTVEEMAQIARKAPDPEPRNRAFHELAMHAYTAYEQGLADQSAMDFDDLLISAAQCVRDDGGAARLQLDRNDSIAIRDIRWILIDEFQDFSELYYRLIKAMLDVNPSIRVVCVGDDWQAINGFAGAQLTYFNSFGEYFPDSGTATISTNRRSGRAIVGAGNLLMQGQGVPAHAHHDFDGDISVLFIDRIWPENGSIYLRLATSVRDDGRRSVNWELARAIKTCSDFISQSVYADTVLSSRWMPSVLILSRTDRAYGTTLAQFGNLLGQALLERPDLQNLANSICVGGRSTDLDVGTEVIDVTTAHKAKGKEADTVIVLEAVSRQFPKVHSDNQLFGLFGTTVEDVLAEERRLFYVAATRAEHRLMFLTEAGKESPYLAAMQANRLDGGRPDRKERPLCAEARALMAHLDRIGHESLIRQNVSQAAGLAWNRLTGQLLGLPDVGFSIANDLYAELAWPALNPPIAILTGRHRSRAAAWRDIGWIVY